MTAVRVVNHLSQDHQLGWSEQGSCIGVGGGHAVALRSHQEDRVQKREGVRGVITWQLSKFAEVVALKSAPRFNQSVGALFCSLERVFRHSLNCIETLTNLSATNWK